MVIDRARKHKRGNAGDDSESPKSSSKSAFEFERAFHHIIKFKPAFMRMSKTKNMRLAFCLHAQNSPTMGTTDNVVRIWADAWRASRACASAQIFLCRSTDSFPLGLQFIQQFSVGGETFHLKIRTEPLQQISLAFFTPGPSSQLRPSQCSPSMIRVHRFVGRTAFVGVFMRSMKVPFFVARIQPL